MNFNTFLLILILLCICVVAKGLDIYNANIQAQLNTIQYQTSGCYPHPTEILKDVKLKEKN
jgi:hypothetical protein